MGRMGFQSQNKKESPLDFPRLKLKKDERARILCIEDPEYAYVHELRAPRVGRDGVPEIVKKETSKGEEYETYKYDFVGRHICLGAEDALTENGLDPDNCPACKEARDSSDVAAPARRFAMHVIRYEIKSGSFEVARPFSVRVEVWAFSERIFGKLVDYTTEFGSLTTHDLKLGPCEVEAFQNYPIEITDKPGYLTVDPPNAKANVLRIKETFRENHCKDLRVFVGREVSKKFMQEDLEKVIRASKLARGESLFAEATEFDDKTLTQGLGDILGEGTPLPPAEDPWAAELRSAPRTEPGAGGDKDDALAALLADSSSSTLSTPPAAQPAEPAKLSIDTPPAPPKPRVVDVLAEPQEVAAEVPAIPTPEPTPTTDEADDFAKLLANLDE